MRVKLIAYTRGVCDETPDTICGMGAALCTAYDGEPLNALKGAMSCGHESVAEHASFTFLIEGVSRVLLAQLTRHRLAAYSVESQRYAGLNGNAFTIPESVEKLYPDTIRKVMNSASAAYKRMIENGVPEEDARYIIPQGIQTKLMLTMNARELRHFFAMRCCNRAQWEIRELADCMLEQCKRVSPKLFEKAGAGCVRGKCPEGKRSCGNPRSV